MAKLRYWLGTGFCVCGELLFLLSVGAYAVGQWFRSNKQPNETAK